MKVKRVDLKDDGTLIPGLLIKRILRKPVFYPLNENCGFTSQVIHDKSLVIDKQR